MILFACLVSSDFKTFIAFSGRQKFKIVCSLKLPKLKQGRTYTALDAASRPKKSKVITDGQTDGSTDRQIDRRTDRRIDRPID